jgi:serine/threonine-protein kinase haspin
MDEPVYGVKATLIDLGLSRMDAGDGEDGVKVHWTPFAEEIFMGEGEYQFDIYRIMREHNQDAWEEYRPMTNVLVSFLLMTFLLRVVTPCAQWLHYLLIKLLHSKHLKPPPVSRKLAVTATPATSFTEKNCYDCLVEVEKVLDRCVDAVSNKTKTNLPTGRGRKKVVAGKAKAVKLEEGPQSASDVIGYGLKRGWVR